MDISKKSFYEALTWPTRNITKALGGIAAWSGGSDHAERLPYEPHHHHFKSLMADIERAKRNNDQQLEGHAAAYASRLIDRTMVQGNLAEAGDMAYRLSDVIPEDISIVPLTPEEISETIERAKAGQTHPDKYVQD